MVECGFEVFGRCCSEGDGDNEGARERGSEDDDEEIVEVGDMAAVIDLIDPID